MKNKSNIKVKIPKALFELYKKENSKIDSKGVLREMLKNQLRGMLTEMDQPGIQNTADEKFLKKTIDTNPIAKQALGRIGANNELDDAFKTLISHFTLKGSPKSTIMSALKAAMNDIEPTGNSITTNPADLKEGVKKVIRIKKK